MLTVLQSLLVKCGMRAAVSIFMLSSAGAVYVSIYAVDGCDAWFLPGYCKLYYMVELPLQTFSCWIFWQSIQLECFVTIELQLVLLTVLQKLLMNYGARTAVTLFLLNRARTVRNSVFAVYGSDKWFLLGHCELYHVVEPPLQTIQAGVFDKNSAWIVCSQSFSYGIACRCSKML